MSVLRVPALVAGIAILSVPIARADSVMLSGSTSDAGVYSTSQLAAKAVAGDTVSYNGLTGISLWGLLGGANASSPTSPSYGDITTSTPAGDNGKNSILRYYVVGSGGGAQAAVSLGQIDPNFGGTTANSPAGQPFVAFQTTGGSLLATPELVVPGAPGSTVSSLTNLQLLSVPALPAVQTNSALPPTSSPGGPSSSVTLSGLVKNPGAYTSAAGFPSTQQTVSGDTYTGTSLINFLNPISLNASQIVVGTATDGLEVVFSLSELMNLSNIIAFSATGTDFPADGIARTILPGDNAHGRFISNLSSLEVDPAATPLPASWTAMLIGLAGFGLLSFRRTRRQSMPIGA
jgi:hypothetical protein